MAYLYHSVTIITETVLKSEPDAVGNGLSPYSDGSILWGHQMLPPEGSHNCWASGREGLRAA